MKLSSTTRLRINKRCMVMIILTLTSKRRQKAVGIPMSTSYSLRVLNCLGETGALLKTTLEHDRVARFVHTLKSIFKDKRKKTNKAKD